MTYFTALKLDKEPFSNSPDPAFFYRSIEHSRVLNCLEIAIRLKRGMSIVLGEVGTGKTTLCRALLQQFSQDENDFIFHIILDPSFKSEYQFLTHLNKIFGLNPFFRSTIDQKEVIEKYLFKKCVEEHKTVVLLIDEGQKLTLPQLEILRTLLNYETNEHKMLQLVIFAQMELLPKIKTVPNFMDRISLKSILNPLDRLETEAMINFRLKQAGYQQNRNIFSHEAIQKIYDFTQGYPRQIARLCHNAVEHIVAGDYEMVTGKLIDQLIEKDKLWM